MTLTFTYVQHGTVLRLKVVWKRLGISRSKGYELMRRDASFPKRLSLGGRAVGILEEHLNLWISQQVADITKPRQCSCAAN